jgi:single-strand DNA-binding protein
MSALKNNVQLIGNLGNNPEITNLESGKKVAKFSIAVNEFYKDKEGEKVVNTSWFNLIAWNKTAELVELLLIKGSEVIISGKLSNSSYEDKDGVKRYITEINVNEFQLMSGGKPKNSNETE